jgi:DNA-binding CsgD family transcriptional regulator
MGFGPWIMRRANKLVSNSSAALLAVALNFLTPLQAAPAVANPLPACQKPVYLTFDTGHMGVAPLIAKVLRQHQVPVTFFGANEKTQEGDGSLGSHWASWWKERGAKGLLDFRDGPDEWLNCVNQVLDGKLSQTPTAKSALDANDSKRGLQLLSKREMQVAQLLVRGFSAEQVAKKNGTTEGTIKNQRKSIYQKLKIVRSTQLAWAMGNGVRAPRG